MHVFGVADVYVAAVLFGGSWAAPSRQRRDDVTGNVGIAAQEAHGSQEEKRTKQPTHPYYPQCTTVQSHDPLRFYTVRIMRKLAR